jgi:hypothetical protein
MAEREGASWLRYGCFGCLGVILLAVLIVIGVTGLAALQARDEKLTQRELVPAIPAPDSTATESVAIETGKRGGRVILSLFHAEFEILPATPGEPLRVEASYDENSYELVERFDDNAESGWVYKVTFRRTGGQLMTGLKQMFSGSRPRVAVYLPRDVKIDLDLETQQGGLEANLGGLWLGTAEIRLDQGGIQLGFDEPLREPMDRLAIDFSMGGGEMTMLGNASPAVLDLELSMGGAEIDLRGNWIQDATIRLDTRMGRALVRLPRDVLIEGIDREGLNVEETGETRPPRLTFEISADDRQDVDFID